MHKQFPYTTINHANIYNATKYFYKALANKLHMSSRDGGVQMQILGPSINILDSGFQKSLQQYVT